ALQELAEVCAVSRKGVKAGAVGAAGVEAGDALVFAQVEGENGGRGGGGRGGRGCHGKLRWGGGELGGGGTLSLPLPHRLHGFFRYHVGSAVSGVVQVSVR